MKKTSLDKYIEKEIQKDPSLEKELDRTGQAIDIAIQIYSLRKRKNLTQAQLARIAHVKQSNIARLESADYEGYSKKTLEKIAAALNVNLTILLLPKENIDSVSVVLGVAFDNQTQQVEFLSHASALPTNLSVAHILIDKKTEPSNEIVEINWSEDDENIQVPQYSYL